MAHELTIGVALPANVGEAAKKLAYEIKGLDTWVESVKAKLPEGVYSAWKLWAKGTSDAMIMVATKSLRGEATALSVLPFWPAGALGAFTTAKVDQAFDDTAIALEYEKLRVWRQTFKQVGQAPPGPEPTPPPGIGVPGAGTDLMSGVSKVILLGLGGLAGVLLLSNVLRG